MIVARSKRGILVGLMFFAVGNLATPAGQGESRGDVELGKPPVKPFYWLDLSKSIFPPRAKAISVQTSSRPAVVNLFDTVYTPALAVAMGWTGSCCVSVPGARVVSGYLAVEVEGENGRRARKKKRGASSPPVVFDG